MAAVDWLETCPYLHSQRTEDELARHGTMDLELPKEMPPLSGKVDWRYGLEAKRVEGKEQISYFKLHEGS